MKKYLLLLLTVFALNSCEKDPEIIGVDAEKKLPKVDVCHYDSETDTWKTLNISENALNAHLKHGDVKLIDEDGDGYVTLENECLSFGDCDDSDAEINPGAEEICGDGIDNNCNGEIDENCDDPCLDEAINQVSVLIQGLGGTNLIVTKTSSNTFLISWTSGRDGRSCIETTAEATGDPETSCAYTNLHHEAVDCP